MGLFNGLVGVRGLASLGTDISPAVFAARTASRLILGMFGTDICRGLALSDFCLLIFLRILPPGFNLLPLDVVDVLDLSLFTMRRAEVMTSVW